MEIPKSLGNFKNFSIHKTKASYSIADHKIKQTPTIFQKTFTPHITKPEKNQKTTEVLYSQTPP